MPLLSSSTLELVSLNPNPYAMVFGDGAYGKEFRDMKPQDQALVMGLVALWGTQDREGPYLNPALGLPSLQVGKTSVSHLSPTVRGIVSW